MAYDYKQDFPLLRALDVAYIDNAATAQRPQCVLDAENDFYCRHNANPLRGLYPLSVEATDAYEAAREAVRDFLGAASTQEIIFTRNTTESLNLVAYSYGLSHIKTGDEVVVSIMEHHSNLLPWQMVCRQTGATLKFMECEPDGSLDLHKVEQLITERTKLVTLTQVSNVLGRQYPVREIAAMAHKKGAVIVVDGAQSTPHIPVNVRELGADFLAFSGHKLYGPMGIGGLYGRRELLDEMPPFLSGGEMIETVTREGATYAELPHTFEAGTVNAAGAAGLHAADPEHLAKHDQNDRSDERQRNQPQRVFSGRLYEQIQTEKHHAQQTADQRAEQTISAVLAGVLHIRAHAENSADAGKRRTAVKKVIDERAESRRQCGLDVAHPHAGDSDGFQRHVLPPESFVETAVKRSREPAGPSPSGTPNLG